MASVSISTSGRSAEELTAYLERRGFDLDSAPVSTGNRAPSEGGINRSPLAWAESQEQAGCSIPTTGALSLAEFALKRAVDCERGASQPIQLCAPTTSHQSIEQEFLDFKNFVSDAVEPYRSELSHCLWPIFVNAFIDLVIAEKRQLSRRFENLFGGLFVGIDLYRGLVHVLRTVHSPQDLQQCPALKDFRENKTLVRLSFDSWLYVGRFLRHSAYISNLFSLHVDISIQLGSVAQHRLRPLPTAATAVAWPGGAGVGASSCFIEPFPLPESSHLFAAKHLLAQRHHEHRLAAAVQRQAHTASLDGSVGDAHSALGTTASFNTSRSGSFSRTSEDPRHQNNGRHQQPQMQNNGPSSSLSGAGTSNRSASKTTTIPTAPNASPARKRSRQLSSGSCANGMMSPPLSTRTAPVGAPIAGCDQQAVPGSNCRSPSATDSDSVVGGAPSAVAAPTASVDALFVNGAGSAPSPEPTSSIALLRQSIEKVRSWGVCAPSILLMDVDATGLSGTSVASVALSEEYGLAIGLDNGLIAIERTRPPPLIHGSFGFRGNFKPIVDPEASEEGDTSSDDDASVVDCDDYGFDNQSSSDDSDSDIEEVGAYRPRETWSKPLPPAVAPKGFQNFRQASIPSSGELYLNADGVFDSGRRHEEVPYQASVVRLHPDARRLYRAGLERRRELRTMDEPKRKGSSSDSLRSQSVLISGTDSQASNRCYRIRQVSIEEEESEPCEVTSNKNVQGNMAGITESSDSPPSACETDGKSTNTSAAGAPADNSFNDPHVNNEKRDSVCVPSKNKGTGSQPVEARLPHKGDTVDSAGAGTEVAASDLPHQKQPPLQESENASSAAADLHANFSSVKESIYYNTTTRRRRRRRRRRKFPQRLASLGSRIRLIGHGAAVTALAHASPSLLLSASVDTTVRAWDASSAEMLNVALYSGHQYPIGCLAVSPEGLYFATGSADTTARLWTPSRPHPLRVMAGHLAAVDAIAFHPNANYLATAAAGDQSMRLWATQSGTVVRVFPDAHRGHPNSLAFAPNGHWLAAAGEDRKVRVWDLRSTKLLAEFDGHRDGITSVVFTRAPAGTSPSSALLLSASFDGTVRIWDVQRALPFQASAAACRTYHDHSYQHRTHQPCSTDASTDPSTSSFGPAKGSPTGSGYQPLVCSLRFRPRPPLSPIGVSEAQQKIVEQGTSKMGAVPEDSASGGGIRKLEPHSRLNVVTAVRVRAS